MKKEYVLPVLKSLDVNEETLMLGVSIEGTELNIDNETPGNAGEEGTAKLSIWDD